MKIGLGLYRHMLTPENFRFARQAGATHIVAHWVDYWGEVEGDTVGIAIFDHPDNLRHPTTWHARDYGLVAANPFGLHDFLNEPANAGAYRIEPGDSLVLKYRFVFHRGDATSADIPSLYDSWAKGSQP